jgi:hypothetical protein
MNGDSGDTEEACSLQWTPTPDDRLREAVERAPTVLRHAIPILVFASLLPVAGGTPWLIAPSVVYFVWTTWRLFAAFLQARRETKPSPIELVVRRRGVHAKFGAGYAVDVPDRDVRMQRTPHGLRLILSGIHFFIPNRVLESNNGAEVMIQREFESTTLVLSRKHTLASYVTSAALLTLFFVFYSLFKHQNA